MLATALLLLAVAPGQTELPRTEALIKQMGSERYAQRDRAMAELEAIGAPALEALRRAAKSTDMETARRAGELVRRIEEQLLAAQALAPKKVRLKLTDVPVLDAVAELSRQSGYPVQITGDRAALTGRTVTLETGDITFWEAFDLLATRGGLAVPGARPTPKITAAPVPAIPAVVPRPLGVRTPTMLPPPEQITLTPGAPARHFSHAGAARVELNLSRPTAARDGIDYQLVLNTAAEPRLQGFTLIGGASLKRALDEQGRTLQITDAPDAPAPTVNPYAINGVNTGLVPKRQQALLLHLPTGEHRPRLIKELSGTLPARVTMPNELLARLDVTTFQRDGARVVAQGKSGGSLAVNSFDRLPNGDYRVAMVLENLGPNLAINLGINANIRGNVVVLGNAWNGPTTQLPGLPDLLDAQGRKYTVWQVPNQSTRVGNNQFVYSATVIYRPHPGQGPPSQLALHGLNSVTVPVSFTFRDVALD